MTNTLQGAPGCRCNWWEVFPFEMGNRYVFTLFWVVFFCLIYLFFFWIIGSFLD
uniref:Uncharacterized protein n=1 Tax=Rhizophora mucronata TaxID=61149 RepID=A0A2P2MJ09_RHIMU